MKKTKVQRESSASAAAKHPLEDSYEEEEELGVDGKPKHRFYNEDLELKTKAI